MLSHITLELPHSPANPRNSEGAFVTLADGRILFAYTRYTGASWSDDATADIAARTSADGGETWSTEDRILVPNEGQCNVMSVSLLRLADSRLALWYLRKNGILDCRPWLRVSVDEGETWGVPMLCIPAPGYFVLNNNRVVQLSDGRLLLPAAYHRARRDSAESFSHAFDRRATAHFFYSDDGGVQWDEAEDWLALPARSQSGLQEPGAVELRDGRLYAWARTGTGRQWQMFSHDRGLTWSQPEPAPFLSPCAPLAMKRLPQTGDLLAVWNDLDPRWGLLPKALLDGWPATPDTSMGRTPLVAAISHDEGATWPHTRLLEDDPRRGFCYTAIHPVGDAALLAYCCGGVGGAALQDLCIRKVSLDWLYGC